jgi:hypothetical protein
LTPDAAAKIILLILFILSHMGFDMHGGLTGWRTI